MASLPEQVLVVVASPTLRSTVTHLLADIGIPAEGVRTVGSLSEARRALTAAVPDCILLDLSLPDAAGLESVAVLVAAVPDAAVVVLTGGAADALVFAAMAQGADEYALKASLTPSKLRQSLLDATRRRRTSDRGRARSVAAAAILDTIDAPTVALDGNGRISAFNRAWSTAGATFGVQAQCIGVGVNYLTICDQAVGDDADGAAATAAGIRQVLYGEVDSFAIDYPCHSPTRHQWFSLRVTPIGELGGGAVLTHLDITGLKGAEHEIRRGQALMHSVFDESAPIFALFEPNGVVRYVSEATAQVLGLDGHDLIGLDGFRTVEPGDLERTTAAVQRVAAAPGRDEQIEIRVVDGNGFRHKLDIAIVNMLDDPKVGAVAVTGCDVTEGYVNQIARRIETRLLQCRPDAVTVTDDRGVVVYWNERATAMYGFSHDQAMGRRIAELHIAPDGPLSEEMVRSLQTAGRWEGDYEATRADGTHLPVHMALEHMVDDEIGLCGIMGTSTDVSERRHLEESLAFQALHDQLTGLPNRRLFVENLEISLARAARDGKHIAVLSIDLDEFKTINDRIGKDAGDRVLHHVGTTISQAMRRGDVVARLGGDEFVVCCDELAGAEEGYEVADSILERLAESFEVGGEPMTVAASIGIAVSGPDSRADGLLRNADIAMYSAKQSGKGRVELFDDDLHNQVRRRRELGLQLKAALDGGQIQTLFQPEINLVTGALVGFEALARWPDPQRGMIPPSEFIPVAEEWGLIGQLGRQVLEDSCRAVRAWAEAAPDRAPKVAVNVSGDQLADPSFPDMVRGVFEQFGVTGDQICIEVTETILIEADIAAAALWKLKETGVEIAIDDFGTGYSSLSRLHQFPLDYLKIDSGFVAGMSERTEDAVIVSCVLALARGLGVRTIAEGIEEGSQLEQLAASGCEYGQGWLWSPAVSFDEALGMVATGQPFRKAVVTSAT